MLASGLGRAVRPAHSMFDGDTIFAVATGARPLVAGDNPLGPVGRAAALDRLCAAADAFARAMVRGLLAAGRARPAPPTATPGRADRSPPRPAASMTAGRTQAHNPSRR